MFLVDLLHNPSLRGGEADVAIYSIRHCEEVKQLVA